MPKLGAKQKTVTGVVTRIMGDRSVNPTSVMISVFDGVETHQIRPEWIVAVEESDGK